MADKSLEIGIDFKTSGGPDAEAELARLRAQIKGAHDDTAAYNAKLKEMAGDSGEAIKPTEKLSEATQEGGEHIKGFNVHGKEMHKLIHEVSTVSPVAGLALKAAFNPSTIGIAAIVVGIELLLRKLEDEKKKTEELITARAQLKSTVWESQRNALREAAVAAADYAEAIQKIYDAKDKLKQFDAVEKAQLEARLSGYKQLIAAQEELEIAKAGGDKVKEEEIRARFAGRKGAADLDAEAQRIKQMEHSLGSSNNAVTDLRAKSDAANQRKLDGDPDASFAAASAKWLEQNAGKLDEAQAKVDLLDEKMHSSKYSAATAYSAMGEMPGAKENLEKIKTATEEATAAVASHADMIKSLENEANATKSALESQKNTSAQFESAIEIAKAVLAENTKSNRTNSVVTNQTHIAKTGIGNFDTEYGLVGKYRNDKNSLSPDEKQHLMGQYSMFAGAGQPMNLEAAVKAFESAKNSQEIARRISDRILTVLERMGEHGEQLARHYTEQDRRIANIESRLNTEVRQR